MRNAPGNSTKGPKQVRAGRYMDLGVNTLRALGEAGLLNHAYEKPWLIEALLEHEKEHGVDERTREWIRGLPLASNHSGNDANAVARVTLPDGQFREFRRYRDAPPAGLEPAKPEMPPPRLMCDACGDVTRKPHGWLCRALAAIDRWTGMRKGGGEEA